MSTALYSAVSGLDAYQEQMDIIGNNIANINTVGFKTATGNLADSFSNTLQVATDAVTGTAVNGTNAMQVGTGVYTGSITNDWSQGGINSTGVNTDLYINGNGFFVLGNSTAATTPNYVSQDGTFTINSQGYLVQANTGMYVMGANTAGTPPTGLGAIKIDTAGYTGSPTAS